MTVCQDTSSGSQKSFRWILFTGCAVSTLLMIEAAPAYAQAVSIGGAQSESVGDIIVTARKKDERLLDVPVAITAFSGEALAKSGISDLSAVGNLIPQVRFETAGGGGNGATYAIRGIGSASGDKGIEQTVAINIDGVQSSRGRISVLSFFDVAQIEVLKGPQALYFGKNSPGGVVSIRSADPGTRFEGYARAGYEFNARERFVEGAVGGPLSSTFGARIAVRASQMDGWVKNVAQPMISPFDPTVALRPAANRIPGGRQILGRVTLQWKPSNDFDATLKVFGADDKRNNEYGAMETVCSGAHASTFGQVDPSSDCKLDNRTSQGTLPTKYAGAGWRGSRDGMPYNDSKAVFSTLRMNYRAEKFNIASVTGYYHLNADGFDNYDGTIFSRLNGYTFEKSSAFSEELRVVTTLDMPFNFTVGAYYETQKRTSGGVGGVGQNIPDANGIYPLWDRTEHARGKTYSGFGQVDWKITDQLDLTAGVRYIKENKNADVANQYVNQAQSAKVILLPQGVVLNPRTSDDNWSPEATLTYKPRPGLMIYAAYRTGFKSGGVSATSVLGATATAQNLVFKPEKAKGGEVGMKAQLLDRRLTVVGAIYSYTFSDLQSTAFNATTTSFSISNAGKARTRGVELEGNFRVSDSLSLSGAVAYNEGKYTSYVGAPCYAGQTAALGCVGGKQDLTGAQLPYNPAWSGNLGFTFDAPINDALMFGVNGRATYNGAFWANTTNNPLARQDSYVRVDAGFRVYRPNQAWELAFIGRNLTNRRYAVYAPDKPGGPATGGQILAAGNRPRELMIQGTVRF